MPRSAARSTPAWALLVLAGITLAGLVLRVAGMDESLYGDERYTHNIVTGNGPGGIWHEVYTTSITPPLHYYLAWISVQLPGDDTILIRLPSLVLGTAAIPLIFLFGRRVGGVPVGLAAAALLALDPFAIFFSTEARAYETQVFLILVATLSLLRATDGGRRLWWAVWAVASAAAMWTHYSSLFVLVALPVWAVWARPAYRRDVVLWGLAAIVLWLPWVPGFLNQRGNPGVDQFDTWAAQSLRVGLGYPVRVVLGHPFVGLRALPGWPALLLVGGIALLGVAALVARRRPRWGRSPGRTALVLVVALAVATPVGTLLYGLVGPSLYLARNLSASQPAMLVLIALAACELARRVPGRVAAGLGAVAVTGLVLVAARSLDPDDDRPPYRKAAEYIDADSDSAPVIEQAGLIGNDRLSRTLLPLYLDGDRPLYAYDTAPPSAWQRARDGGSVFFAAPIEDVLLHLLGADRIPEDVQARRNLVGGPNNMLRVRETRIFPGFDPVVVQRLSGEVQGQLAGERIDWTFGSGVPVEQGAVEGAAGVTPAPGGADLAGWAVDGRTGRPADWVLVFHDDRLVAVTGLGIVSEAARREGGDPALLSGFAMRMAGEGLEPEALRVVAVAGDRAGDLPVAGG